MKRFNSQPAVQRVAIGPTALIHAIWRRLCWLGTAKTSSSAVVYTVLSRIGSLGLNLATSILVARLLGPTGRGEVGAMTLWPTLICGMIGLGIPVALRYEVRREIESPSAELFTATVIVNAVLGTVAMVAGIFLLPHLLVRYSAPVIYFSQALMLLAPQIMLQTALQAFLEARGDFIQANRVNYVLPVVTLTALLLLEATHRISPYTAALSYACAPIFVTVWSIYHVRRSFKLPKQFIKRISVLLHYGLRAYPIDVLATLSFQIDQAVVVGLLSATSFGLYAVALNVSRTLGLFSGSLNTVLFPRASSLRSDEAVALVNKSARLIFAITAIAALCFVIILPVFVKVAYGSAYAGVVAISKVLTIEVVLSATTATFAQVFLATGRPGLVALLQAGGLATTLPLMLLLVPRLGLMGAALALLGSTMARLALVLVSYPVFLQQRMPSLIPSREDLRDVVRRVRDVA